MSHPQSTQVFFLFLSHSEELKVVLKNDFEPGNSDVSIKLSEFYERVEEFQLLDNRKIKKNLSTFICFFLFQIFGL